MNNRMHERMQARQAKHLQELKAKLQLAPTQDTAWTGFTGVLQARPTPHTAPGTGQDWAQLSTPERLERMKAMRTQHQSEMNAFMDRRADATKALYAALTPEQQKVFDAETARMMKTRGHGHGHGHGMHGGRGQS
jgi:Spy/CpxP family protein refolding chaperone